MKQNGKENKMKQIKINAYEFKELNQEDRFPIDYDTGEVDEYGKPIIKYDYFSSWLEQEVQEHCEINNYLFSKNGQAIHYLEIKQKGQ
jgi:hypothetical protein